MLDVVQLHPLVMLEDRQQQTFQFENFVARDVVINLEVGVVSPMFLVFGGWPAVKFVDI